MYQNGGGQWWIITEERSGEVNISTANHRD